MVPQWVKDLYVPKQPECFLCGKLVVHKDQLVFFVHEGRFAPRAPAHLTCFEGRDEARTAAAYHRWVADVANVPRAHIGPVGRA